MKKFLIIFLSVLAALTLFLVIYGNYCNNALTVTQYTVENNKNNATLRVALLSDLHGKDFGENNKALVDTVKSENPDIIALCGDMVSNDTENLDVLENLLRNLKQIAPTYFVYGNHELDIKDKFDFEKLANDTGTTLLDNETTIIKTDKGSIVLGGLSDFPYYEFFKPEFDTPERYLWEEISLKSKTEFTILIHHQPEYLPSIVPDSDIDLILCGHTHGGLIRLPFVGGIIAPNQKVFPEYDKGLFELDKTDIIISAGLGNTSFLPRYGNPPEICIIDII